MKNRYQILGLLTLVAALVLSACGPFAGVGQKTVYVGPSLADCVGVAPQKCMLVKSDPDGDWTYFYDQIQGFDYEPGYEYELEVREDKIKNPPADASSIQWTLVEVVSKERSMEGNTWALVSYQNSAGEMVEVLPDSEVTTVFQDGHLGGSAGCNSYFGQYVVDGSKISVTMGGSTMMFCAPPELMDQEQAFLAALGQAGFWIIEGDELRLAGADGKPLLNYEVLQPTELVGTNWLLTGYNNGKGGFASALAGTEITAMFTKDGKMGGSAGCNQYNAPYEISGATPGGGSMTIGLVATTMKMCVVPEGIAEQEQAYLAAFERVRSFEIEGQQLTLYDHQGTRMAAYTVQPATPLVGTPWQATHYNNGKGGFTTVLAGTEITALFGEDGTVAGLASCNNYTTSFQVEDPDADSGPISIDVGATTRMMCAAPEGIMEQEDAFLAALQSSAIYRIEGDQLELRDLSGTRMVTFAPDSGEGSALDTAPPEGAVGSEDLVGTVWQWASFSDPVEGSQTIDNPAQYTIEFLPDGKASIQADCNHARGTYTAEESNILIEIGPMTRAMCGPDSLSDEFIFGLGNSRIYFFEGGALYLDLYADGGTMQFTGQ